MRYDQKFLWKLDEPGHHKSAWPRRPGSWWALAKEVWAASCEDDVFGRAAQLGFYFLLAAFPAMLGVTSLIGMLPRQVVVPNVMPYAREVLPAESLVLVERYVEQMIQGSGGGLFSLSLLGSLWAASWGMMAIINTLNAVYGVKETRPIWKAGITAVLLTLGAAVFFITSLILILAGEEVSQWVTAVTGFEWWSTLGWPLLQWPIIVFLMLMAINLVYYWAPNSDQEWQWMKPGSMLAVFLWIILSLGLKFYVENFINYNAVYGPITGVIILMMWLYVGGLTLLIGGELNFILKRPDTMDGSVSSEN
ncbi:YihY/virulence factor BrkB family protein [Candidatus Nitrospira allomarina]|uniref:YihY/virulence factor BrkB family protein n=1 Tax=Candidatus Nitrospira allomarina TaxID=3020900 RepID=A0AA96GDE8_9BACT|nr:YihY/virulence factor BrkB family protein [Candidatus Nitrospira allomarina]WNM56719.1 YihY/virulence factor BrkB family protein [Candidatus Nitrospira allomarina]